jgi:hypothetical protein
LHQNLDTVECAQDRDGQFSGDERLGVSKCGVVKGSFRARGSPKSPKRRYQRHESLLALSVRRASAEMNFFAFADYYQNPQ